METWQLVLVVLAALCIGAFLPMVGVLFSHVNAILRELRATTTGVRKMVESAESVADRFEQLSHGLEGGEEKIKELMNAVGEITASVEKLKGSVKTAAAVGTALGPALAAFISGMRSSGNSSNNGQRPALEAVADRSNGGAVAAAAAPSESAASPAS